MQALNDILTANASHLADLLTEYAPETVLPSDPLAIEITDDSNGNITARIYGGNKAVIDITFHEPD